MRKLVAGLALLLLLWGSGEAGAAVRVVTAAADPWPPFVDPDNPTQGISLEILRAAFGTQGYEVDMQFMPWARAMTQVKDGFIDILPDAWMTEERKKDLRFGDPYAANDFKFIKRKGDPYEYEGLASLAGKTVCVVRDYGYGDEFLHATHFSREAGSDLVMNVRKLVAGRCDLTLEDEIVARNLLMRHAPELLGQIEFTQQAMSSTNMHVACGLRNPRCGEIIEAFNRGLAAIRASGSFDEIMRRYGGK